MNSVFILFFIPVLKINANWMLKWHDEFDKVTIDQNNWEIDESDDKKCDEKWNIGRLNCYTNSTKNLRLINGTLALTALYEKKLNKKYTSAWIRTRKNFTYGKIEIRAALPIGKMLSPWIKLVPPKFKDQDGFVRKNQVIVFHGDQSNYVKYGYSVGHKLGNVEEFLAIGRLSEFHTYSIEWNDTDLIWKFDGIETNSLNLNQSDTFLRYEVILTFYLRVGGQPFKNGVLTLEDVYDWVCSLFILDYVRYYQWTDEEQVNSTEKMVEERSSVDFCENIMNENRPQKEEPSNINLTTIISASCLLLLLALIPLIVWLVIRTKKIRKPEQQVVDPDNYYDDIDHMEMYEEVNKDHTYAEYADPYELADRNSNYYADSAQSYIPVFVTDEQDPDYLTMKAKSRPPQQYVLESKFTKNKIEQ